MESYDVIIVGGGIAGTGLAYNLSKICPEKSVLVIDKNEIGGNFAYGYRTLDKESVESYKLPFSYKYKGLKLGVHDEILASANKEIYLVDYKEVCNNMISRSRAKFRKEVAFDVTKNTLITNKARYNFKYLVDCSGIGFFLKKKLKHNLPFRYWVGRTRLLNNNIKEMGLDKDYFYYTFDDDGYVEDIYPLNGRILQGDWQYLDKINFNLIRVPERNFFKKIKNPNIIRETRSVIPCAPVLPLVYRNYAFLGDCFGNTTASSAIGLKLNLESSKMLSNAILNNNLKLYENEWKKKYLNLFISHLAFRLDRYNSSIFKAFKNYPCNRELIKLVEECNYSDFFIESLLETKKPPKLPRKINDKFPKIQKIFLLYHFLSLKFKYTLMQVRH